MLEYRSGAGREWPGAEGGLTNYLHSLLMQIPDEFKPWAALMLGACILVGLVLVHGSGIHSILMYHTRNERRLWLGRPHHIEATILFGTSVFLMLGLHIFGVLVWAFLLKHLGLILKANDAIYFCANAYTTLGYGNVDIDPLWRNISPIIGISGLFTFAWDHQRAGGGGDQPQPAAGATGDRARKAAGVAGRRAWRGGAGTVAGDGGREGGAFKV